MDTQILLDGKSKGKRSVARTGGDANIMQAAQNKALYYGKRQIEIWVLGKPCHGLSGPKGSCDGCTLRASNIGRNFSSVSLHSSRSSESATMPAPA